MALLSDVDRDRVRAALAALPSPVRLLFFTQTIGCESCGPTRRILDETSYAASPDGRRFLLNSVKPDADPTTITVVLNWQTGLTRRGRVF